MEDDEGQFSVPRTSFGLATTISILAAIHSIRRYTFAQYGFLNQREKKEPRTKNLPEHAAASAKALDSCMEFGDLVAQRCRNNRTGEILTVLWMTIPVDALNGVPIPIGTLFDSPVDPGDFTILSD